MGTASAALLPDVSRIVLGKLFPAYYAQLGNHGAACMSDFFDGTALTADNLSVMGDAMVARADGRKIQAPITCVIEVIDGSFSGLGAVVAGKLPDTGVVSLVIRPGKEESMQAALDRLAKNQLSNILVVPRALDDERIKLIQPLLAILQTKYPKSVCAGVIAMVAMTSLEKLDGWSALVMIT